MIPDSIRYIVFDFGAVIINIDVPLTYKAFATLSGKTENEVKHLFEQQGAYGQYEIGKLDDAGFRTLIRDTLQLDLTDEEVDATWNTLLLDVPEERVTLLRHLANDYPIYLLSNTNPIHIRECREIIKRQHGIDNFRTLFTKTYMSYEIGLLKPDAEIYHYVMNDIGCKPEEILFLDDNLKNIEGASALGIHTRLITQEQDVIYWLNHVSKN